jgi:hypothetical protein
MLQSSRIEIPYAIPIAGVYPKFGEGPFLNHLSGWNPARPFVAKIGESRRGFGAPKRMLKPRPEETIYVE